MACEFRDWNSNFGLHWTSYTFFSIFFPKLTLVESAHVIMFSRVNTCCLFFWDIYWMDKKGKDELFSKILNLTLVKILKSDIKNSTFFSGLIFPSVLMLLWLQVDLILKKKVHNFQFHQWPNLMREDVPVFHIISEKYLCYLRFCWQVRISVYYSMKNTDHQLTVINNHNQIQQRDIDFMDY